MLKFCLFALNSLLSPNRLRNFTELQVVDLVAHNVPRAADSELLNEARYPAFRVEAADLLNVVPSIEWLEALVAYDQIAYDITFMQGRMLGFKLLRAARSCYDRGTACLFILLDIVPDEHTSVINGNCGSLNREMVS